MKILRENTPGESSMQSSIQTAPEALAPTAAPAAPTAPETTPETRFRCRHIHVSGTRCGSPCLRREPFCYFHHTTRPPVTPAQVAARAARRADFALPMPEDRAAIQLSIGEVLQRIAANQLDPRRAGLLLYGLQIASGNLPPQAAARPLSALAESAARELVEEIEHDPELGTLAPQANLADPPRYRNAMRVLLDKIERKDAARRQQEALELHKKKLELEQQMLHEQAHNLCPSCAADKTEPAVAESPAVLPEVQAVAARGHKHRAPRSVVNRMFTTRTAGFHASFVADSIGGRGERGPRHEAEYPATDCSFVAGGDHNGERRIQT
jgi:hypothetical protein